MADDPRTLLARLVAIPSVCRQPNAAITGFVRDHLAAGGIEAALLPGPEGDRTNLLASIGPRDVPGLVLSAHLDTVPAPADGWTGDPFTLRTQGDRLVGRGTTDMKAFVACLLALAPELAAARPARPIHLALSYDEEVGCVGVRHLLAALPGRIAPPTGALVGEPTGLRAVLAHKGKAARRITVRGRAGHSARPDLADNAIHLAAELILATRDAADRLAAEGPRDPRFAPPTSTLQVGTVTGGVSVNIVPDRCELELEARAIPGTDPDALLDPIDRFAATRVAALAAIGARVAVETTPLSSYPALDLAADHPLAAAVEAAAGRGRQAAVSFGTEAGLYQAAGIPAVVCGPGDMADAHRPDESIAAAEIDACLAMLRRLTARFLA